MPASLTLRKATIYVGVRPGGSTIGLMAKGELLFSGKSYNVISGPWNRGVLPDGTYEVKKYNVVVNSNEAGYQSPSGKGWFIPLQAPAGITRSGFGIHPDGNVEGTAGCIGLVGLDADEFWNAWVKTPMAERPNQLNVSGPTASGDERYVIDGEGANE